MQNLIIRQFKKFLYDTKKPNENEFIHMFENNMAESINKIYTRMKRPNYNHQWIYSRPRYPIEQATKANRFEALSELLRLTLQPLSVETPNNPAAIELTSDLDLDHDETDDIQEGYQFTHQ